MDVQNLQLSRADGSRVLEDIAHAIAEHTRADRSQDRDFVVPNVRLVRQDDGELHPFVGIQIEQFRPIGATISARASSLSNSRTPARSRREKALPKLIKLVSFS